MKLFLAIALSGMMAFTACSSKTQRKILVMGKGTLTANGNNVTYKEGSGYSDVVVELHNDKEATLNITTGGDKKDISVPAGVGYYILNLRTDLP